MAARSGRRSFLAHHSRGIGPTEGDVGCFDLRVEGQAECQVTRWAGDKESQVTDMECRIHD